MLYSTQNGLSWAKLPAGARLICKFRALVRGHLDPSMGPLLMSRKLVKPNELNARARLGSDGDGLVYRTRILSLRRKGDWSVVEAIPLLGTQNVGEIQGIKRPVDLESQVRLHLAGLGHPVVGDSEFSQERCCDHLYPPEVPQDLQLYWSAIDVQSPDGSMIQELKAVPPDLVASEVEWPPLPEPQDYLGVEDFLNHPVPQGQAGSHHYWEHTDLRFPPLRLRSVRGF